MTKAVRDPFQEAMKLKALLDEQAKQRKNNRIFRFSLKKDCSAQIIILDDAISGYRWEHEIWDNNRPTYYGCSNEDSNCPVCATYPEKGPGHSHYYAGYLTILNLTPYERENPKTKVKEVVPFSQQLLCIKLSQLRKWSERLNRALGKKLDQLKETPTGLRGLQLEVRRSTEEMAPRIGSDIDGEGFIDFKDLDQNYLIREFEDSKGNKVTIDLSQPIDYQKLLPKGTKEELEAIFGPVGGPGSPSPSNYGENNRLGDDDQPVF